MDARSVKYAAGLFRSYYQRAEIDILEIGKREFGFGVFEEKAAYIRHMSFASNGDLKRYLVSNVPASAHHSSSFYERPSARPMENKGWLGAELVFDLDATDMKLKCQKNHGTSWVCENCLEGVKAEASKLIEEFLIPDFGFSENEISINFSGNRGYHIHINSREMLNLDSNARKGLSEYITGTGLSVNAFFPTINQRGKRLEGPKPTDLGWGGKIARGMINALNNGMQPLNELGIDSADAKRLVKNKASVMLGISVGNWDKVRIAKKEQFWSNVVNSMTIKQSDSIDRNVTSDIHHMIRVPDTLHSGTGLLSKRLRSVKDLSDFDPMKDAIAFHEGSAKIKTGKVRAFNMNGTAFGPFENLDVELPTYAALYLILKGLAELA